MTGLQGKNSSAIFVSPKSLDILIGTVASVSLILANIATGLGI